MNANMQVGEIVATLNLLNNQEDIPNAKRGPALGYIESFSSEFALNTIPTASIVVPVGSKLDYSGTLQPSYVYGGKNQNNSIIKLANEHVPVGIYARGGFFDTFGNGYTQDYCLFKGYISGMSWERSANSTGMHVNLTHWLEDLTRFPMISSMISPLTPKEIAAQYPLAVSDRDAGQYSKPGLVQSTLSILSPIIGKLNGSRYEDLWSIFKEVFLALTPNPDRLAKDDPGYASKQLLKRAENALKALDGADLDYIPVMKNLLLEGFQRQIATLLASMTTGSFCGITIWDKIINSFLPNFYMALTPRVHDAKIIPMPGQNFKGTKIATIPRSGYLRANYGGAANPILGGVVLHVDPSSNPNILDKCYSAMRFPGDKIKPGPLRLVDAPSWLNLRHITSAMSQAGGSADFYTLYRNRVNRKEADKKKEKLDAEKTASSTRRILNNLVRATYQILACENRQASITLPLNVTPTPGEVVRVEIPPGVADKTTNYLYGTITSVSMQIHPGNACTVIGLSNIRTQAEFDDEELTSKEGTLFSKAWKTNQSLILAERA